MSRSPLVLGLLLAACATTPAPGSREAQMASQIESLESRNEALREELATQRPKLAAEYQAISRAEEAALGSGVACAHVRGSSGQALAAATPARATIAAKKLRVGATYPAGRTAGALTIASGTCSAEAK